MKEIKCQPFKEKSFKTVKTYRKASRLSQQELADLLGVRQATISDWERGINVPNLSNIQKMAQIFNVDFPVLAQDILMTKVTNLVNKELCHC
jgi:transcriptional regulator with XRE-family HTH domain